MNAKKQQLYINSHYINVHEATCNNDNCNKDDIILSANQTNHLRASLCQITTKRDSTQFHSHNIKQSDCKSYNNAITDDIWLHQTHKSCSQYKMSTGVRKTESTCSGTGTVNCVTLKHILESFKAPLLEEHAWAIIYQGINMFRQLCEANRHRNIIKSSEIPETLEDIFLHRDGTVHCSFKPTKLNMITETTTEQEKQQQQRQQQQQQQQNCINNEMQHLICHKKILRNVGIIVYTALDYNLHEDEQCQISKELEDLITYMTTNEIEDDCIDEGIDEGCKRWEDDFENNPKPIETKEFDIVLKICHNHIKPAVPEEHYKAVCRALVTETIELGIFLQHVLINKCNDFNKTDTSNASQQELAKLGFTDWARFWVQVIDELRKGVRLKKSNYVRTPIEYELTPYEILMEDIRSRKYQLRKVMINGDIPPRVKKDAHAIILEFIRSRPPLRKMSDRKLAPPINRKLSPRELLMDSIRKGYTLKHVESPSPLHLHDKTNVSDKIEEASDASLYCGQDTLNLSSKKLPIPKPRSVFLPIGGIGDDPLGTANNNMKLDSKSGENFVTSTSKQRLIKVDFSLLQDDDEIDSEEQPQETSATLNAPTTSNVKSTIITNMSVCAQPKMPPYPLEAYMVSDPMALKSINSGKHETQNCIKTRITQQCMSDNYHRPSSRRHSIVGCQNNLNEMSSTSMSRLQSAANAIFIAGNEFIEQKSERQEKQEEKNYNSLCSEEDFRSLASSTSVNIAQPWSKSFMDKKTWNEVADDRLSLTLEEIVHIRSVMTKAELESLPVGVRVKEDVEKRKICFLCLRTRFSLFGPWGVECKICKRTVCSKCHTKMRIPTEHFRNVPLVLISPSLLSTPAGSGSPSPSHHVNSYIHSSSSTGNILDESFSKTLVERLIRSEIAEPKSCIDIVNTPPPSPKYLRSNMSTPGIRSNEPHRIIAGQAMEATLDKIILPTSTLSGITHTSTDDLLKNRIYNCYVKQQSNCSKNFNIMSRSMEGPRSLPMQSPASRSHSSNSTLDRKSRFSQKLALSSSSSPLGRDQKENVRGEQVPVCNDCHGLVMEITKSAKQKRSSARNRTLKSLTLDLCPVWK